MKYIITISIIFVVCSAPAQSHADWKKIKHYQTKSGAVYSQRYVDSIRYGGRLYVGIKKIRDTPDTIYYSLTFFDKHLTADRYTADGYYCGNPQRKTLRQIRKKFPFNRTQSIKVVSFKDYDSIPKTSGTIDFGKMHEIKTLNNDLAEKMIDILANYDNKNLSMEVAFCWSPKNGVILLDKDEKVLSYFDICFECQLFDFQPANASFGGFCNEKFDAIQGIMKAAGITYGIEKNEN